MFTAVPELLAEVTERLKFLVAFRSDLLSPTLAAQMAATFQRHSGKRLLLNVVTGGESAEQRAFGDFPEKEARYARCDEFPHVVRSLWRKERVDCQGEHIHVEGAELARVPDPVPPRKVAEKVKWIRGLAEQEGRSPRFGIRPHVISRDTCEQAWAEVQRLLDGLDPKTIAQVQEGLARSESEGQRWMLDLHGCSTANLEIYPNPWAGVGLVRGGAGSALVGSHAEVAERIEEYRAVGIEEFVLAGPPHLEEACWFGEGVLPLLARKGLWARPAGAQGGGDREHPVRRHAAHGRGHVLRSGFRRGRVLGELSGTAWLRESCLALVGASTLVLVQQAGVRDLV